MTAAFDTFMEQYNRTGSEKADGYTRSAFDGLSDTERDVVFGLLASELPFSVEWLFYVNAEKAAEVVKLEEERLRGDRYQHVFLLQEYLVKYTGDLVYQAHMIEDFPNYIDRLKPLVVDSLSRTPVNDDVRSFYKKVILAETNSSAVARSARHFLDAHGVPDAGDAEEVRYSHLVQQLRSDDIQVKLLVISQVEAA